MAGKRKRNIECDYSQAPLATSLGVIQQCAISLARAATRALIITGRPWACCVYSPPHQASATSACPLSEPLVRHRRLLK